MQWVRRFVLATLCAVWWQAFGAAAADSKLVPPPAPGVVVDYTAKHGFQYVDWQFDGADLIALCRTAWDDAAGGAHNNHDANFLTFHRWQNFRTLKREAP